MSPQAVQRLQRPTSTETTADPGEKTLSRRIDLACVAMGLAPPPCNLTVRYVKAANGWTIMAQGPPGEAQAVGRWLEKLGGHRVTAAAGIAPRFVRAEFSTLPQRWEEILLAVEVRHVDVTSGGVASIFAEGPAPAMKGCVALLNAQEPDARARPAFLGPTDLKLTHRQMEALSTAVALGYYEIPHRLGLRSVAASMNMSLGSVSELLRRAEAGVITRYVDRMAETRWKDAGKTPDAPAEGTREGA